MVQTIKNLWNKFLNLKWWQQLLLVLPFIILTIGMIIYIFSPIKSKKFDKEILKHNEKMVDKHIEKLVEREEKLKTEQEQHKSERLKVAERIKERENEAEQISKKINNADSIDELLSIHDELSSRVKSRTRSTR